MRMKFSLKVTTFSTCCLLILFSANRCTAQADSAIFKYLSLDSVVIEEARSGFDVNAFIRLMQDDTTFYAAFRNLRKIEYVSHANMILYDKKWKAEATYTGDAQQHIQNGCRWMEFSNVRVTGSFYDDGQEAYYTAKMFAYIFLYKDTICTESNTNPQQLPGYDKKIEGRKDQLKVIMFDPGKKVDGVPFIKNKTAVFDFDIMKNYDFFISSESYLGRACYVFSFQLQEEAKPKDVVVQKMQTWFDKETRQIIARSYDLQYDAGVYDFDVQMDVQLGMKSDIIIPTYIHYSGNWDVPGKPRERATVDIVIQ